MKSINLPSPSLNNTAGIVAIGAASGALAGFVGLAAYGMLVGKGAVAVWAAKTAAGTVGGSGVGWLQLLIPTSAGALGGGASGVGVAKKVVNQQVQEVSEKLEAEAVELRRQLTLLETRVESKQIPAQTVNADEIKLECIKGIGPKFARLLQEAGIHDLRDLAQANLDELRTLLESSSGGQMAKVDSWISQAQALTK